MSDDEMCSCPACVLAREFAASIERARIACDGEMSPAYIAIAAGRTMADATVSLDEQTQLSTFMLFSKSVNLQLSHLRREQEEKMPTPTVPDVGRA